VRLAKMCSSDGDVLLLCKELTEDLETMPYLKRLVLMLPTIGAILQQLESADTSPGNTDLKHDAFRPPDSEQNPCRPGVAGIASELSSLRMRHDQLCARLEERRETSIAEWRAGKDEKLGRPEDWDVPKPSRPPAKDGKKKSHKGKGKRKGHRGQGQTAREAATAGKERAEEEGGVGEEGKEGHEEGEATTADAPAVGGADAPGEEKGTEQEGWEEPD
jgi:hypothetical protein